jgi:hypothetical protein
MLPTDSYVVQKLGLATYKSQAPNPQAALEEAAQILTTLDPVGSNDPETLGLWGAIHKRLWEKTLDPQHLKECIFAYEKGFYLKNDYYNGINLAFALNARAALPQATAPDAIADYVLAARARERVLAICKALLDSERDRGRPLPDHYWAAASLGEALFGLGRRGEAEQVLNAAYGTAPEPWMIESTKEQIAKLDQLIETFPHQSVLASKSEK